MIATNITGLQREYYRTAKEMDINMVFCKDGEIEIIEESHTKGFKFAKAIARINKDCKVIDLIAMGMDKDVRGNVVTGSKALYQVDDEYYSKLMGEEVGQLSMI